MLYGSGTSIRLVLAIGAGIQLDVLKIKMFQSKDQNKSDIWHIKNMLCTDEVTRKETEVFGSCIMDLKKSLGCYKDGLVSYRYNAEWDDDERVSKIRSSNTFQGTGL